MRLVLDSLCMAKAMPNQLVTGWRPSLLDAIRMEAIARMEAITIGMESMAMRFLKVLFL